MIKINYLIITLIWGFLISGSCHQMQAQEKISTELGIINKLEASFGVIFYKSLYSIDELRPYTIIQLEKTITSYDNSWISPDEIILQLDNKNKVTLKKSLAEFLQSVNDVEERNGIINKMRLWCISASQFELMESKMEIDRDRIIKLILPKIPSVVNRNTGEIIHEESDKNNDYLYFMMINQICKLNLSEQLKLYSAIFAELSK